MRITEKLHRKACDNAESAVTIAYLGDSVTQGCFELHPRTDTGFTTVHDREHTYSAYVARILGVLYPTVPVNTVNAGVAGQSAEEALSRLTRDVLAHKPDLTVVCFGLNDCGRGEAELERFLTPLREIFSRLAEAGSEIIFLTPNRMADGVSPNLHGEMLREIAQGVAAVQNAGVLTRYVEAAKELCRACGVPVCDCYAKWETLAKNGVNTTELLANSINHPSREMHWLFAASLVETMMG